MSVKYLKTLDYSHAFDYVEYLNNETSLHEKQSDRHNSYQVQIETIFQVSLSNSWHKSARSTGVFINEISQEVLYHTK